MSPLFNQIGNVVLVRVCRDLGLRKSLGYGFINYNNSNDGPIHGEIRTTEGGTPSISRLANMLVSMSHRGACGCETNTSDCAGAGILVGLPHEIYKEFAESFGHMRLGSRTVPIDNSGLGKSPLQAEPVMNKRVSMAAIRAALNLQHGGVRDFYICAFDGGLKLLVQAGRSLLSIFAVTDGRLVGTLEPYWTETDCSQVGSMLLIVGGLASEVGVVDIPPEDVSRKGRLKPGMMLFPEKQKIELKKIVECVNLNGLALPLLGCERVCNLGSKSQDLWHKISVTIDVSFRTVVDKGAFDGVLKLLVRVERSFPEVVMMIPEAWQNDKNMDPQRKVLYEYFSVLLDCFGLQRHQLKRLSVHCSEIDEMALKLKLRR
ncbi:hypothetical protein QVD17_10294 [Tagetes erecta]|uniref:glutamate synthase (ferredoxin) n=1 Tax=Tagetes erecta TaxID=13708 RepID=A0AAD8P5T6_TARER|nr:hypothetical protein QVD17_10294 [Tagetes erecta]